MKIKSANSDKKNGGSVYVNELVHRFNECISHNDVLHSSILAHIVCYDRQSGVKKYGQQDSDQILSFHICLYKSQYIAKVMLCELHEEDEKVQVNDRQVLIMFSWKEQVGIEDGKISRLAGYSDLDVYLRYLKRDMFISQDFQSVLRLHIGMVSKQIADSTSSTFAKARIFSKYKDHLIEQRKAQA